MLINRNHHQASTQQHQHTQGTKTCNESNPSALFSCFGFCWEEISDTQQEWKHCRHRHCHLDGGLTCIHSQDQRHICSRWDQQQAHRRPELCTQGAGDQFSPDENHGDNHQKDDHQAERCKPLIDIMLEFIFKKITIKIQISIFD